ncbi:MAG: sigma-70 family RNA polymerase sigma factor [Pseudomonadota bacterium]
MNLFSSPEPHADSDGSASADDAASTSGYASRLKRLYDRYYDSLVTHLRSKYGAGPPDPDDVAQQTFEKLYERGLVKDIDNLEAFAWTTANNIIRSEHRAQRVRTRHAEEEAQDADTGLFDEFDPERVLMARQELDIVARTLREMPERRREIFIACRINGLTPEQAGRKVGVSRSSAVRHIAVATTMLVEALAKNRQMGDDAACN